MPILHQNELTINSAFLGSSAPSPETSEEMKWEP